MLSARWAELETLIHLEIVISMRARGGAPSVLSAVASWRAGRLPKRRRIDPSITTALRRQHQLNYRARRLGRAGGTTTRRRLHGAAWTRTGTQSLQQLPVRNACSHCPAAVLLGHLHGVIGEDKPAGHLLR